MNISIYLVGFIALSCDAALSPVAKKALPTIPPFAFIAITMTIMVVMSAVASFFYEKDFSLAKMPSSAWGGLVIFTAINFIGFALYLYVISKIPVTQYQLMGLIGPIVGSLISLFDFRRTDQAAIFSGTGHYWHWSFCCFEGLGLE